MMMMKKTSIFIVLYFSLSSIVNAQNLFHSAGSTVSVMYATLARGSTLKQDRFAITHAHLNYFPRYNLPISFNTSLSIGAPIGIGAAFIDNDFMAIHKTFLSYELPFAIDYNMGFKSVIDPGDDIIGFYIGAGYSITNTVGLDSIADTKFIPNSSGILARVGARLPFSYSTTHKGMTIGMYYKLGGGVEKFRTFGINVFVDF